MNMEGSPGRTSRKPWLNGILFVLTLVSTFSLGVLLSLSYLYPDSPGPAPAPKPGLGSILEPRILILAGLYAAVLMIILTGHELGHYLTCRRYGIEATLPYFIPGPTLIGTFGAFIRIQSPVNLKRQWFDIGAAGPLAGFILTVPALFVGLALSKVVPAAASEGAIALGEPLLLKLGSAIFFRHIPAGSSVVLHPVAFAGWAGLLVTFINLFPLGQLDGGHVAYALLGRKKRYVSAAAICGFIILGFFFSYSWLLWGLLGLVFVLVVRLKRPGRLYRLAIRLRHPQAFDEDLPLGRGRTLVGVLVIVVFILSFIPDPIKGTSLLGLLKQAGLGVR
jgi:membrane-associated protease RseP (regulator of RpoE activity)